MAALEADGMEGCGSCRSDGGDGSDITCADVCADCIIACLITEDCFALSPVLEAPRGVIFRAQFTAPRATSRCFFGTLLYDGSIAK